MKTATAMLSRTETTRDLFELLSRREIECEYKIPVPTQCCWYTHNRYQWRDICLKVGARVFVRRHDLEHWLERRRGIVTERHGTQNEGAK